MIPFFSNADSLAARTRGSWVWLGQVGVVILGIHLAADRLDDYVGAMLMRGPPAWVEPSTVLEAGTWVAVALELLVVGWAVWTRLRANGEPIKEPADWWTRRSVQAGLAGLFWLPLGLAGCWVVAMAVEDLLAPLLPVLAIYLGSLVAVFVAWRLALTGWVRIVRQTPKPRGITEGWAWALPVALVSLLAVRHGLPIWGWLP